MSDVTTLSDVKVRGRWCVDCGVGMRFMGGTARMWDLARDAYPRGDITLAGMRCPLCNVGGAVPSRAKVEREARSALRRARLPRTNALLPALLTLRGAA